MSRAQTDFLKGLAIVAVVTIHSISDFIFKVETKNTFWWNFYIVLDQICRFAVPTFVFLSGYGLAISFKGNVVEFYLKRVWKILPLFVLASVIIMVYRNFYENAGFDFFNYHTWTAVLRGGADYHLYFVPMIFRFYLLFPLFYFIIKKFPRLSLLAAFIWQIYWYQKISLGTEILGNWNQIWPDQMQYIDFRSWIFYFVLGIYLSFKISNFKFQIILLLVGLLWSVQNSFSLIGNGIDWLVSNRFTRLPVLVYATSFILFFSKSEYIIPASPAGGHNTLYIILSFLGKHSYFIYLFHTIVLRHLAPYHFSSGILIALTLIITFCASYIFTRLTSNFRVSKVWL